MAENNGNMKAVGRTGEDLAAEYFNRLGWKVVERNYRCYAGEIDLICLDPTGEVDTLVFVEVKTRRGRQPVSALSAITQRKQIRLVAVALHYLGSRSADAPSGEEPQCRFDAVAVNLLPGNKPSIVHHRGAFTA